MQNLSKDVPNEEVKYPPDTASKNRSPDVLPGKCGLKLLSNRSRLTTNLLFKQFFFFDYTALRLKNELLIAFQKKNKHGHSFARLVLEVD